MNLYTRRLVIAFVASTGIHLLILEVYAVMFTLNVITGRTPKPPELPKQPVPVLTLVEPKPQHRPMTFVETDSSQETKTPPKDSKYYSDRSSLAANPKPDANKTGEKPKLEGKQDKVASTANVPLPQPIQEAKPVLTEPPKPDLQKNLAPQPAQKPAPKPKEDTFGPKKTELAMVTKEPEHKPQPPQPAQPPKPKPEPVQAKLSPPRPERIIPEAESKTDSSVSHEGIKAFDVTGTKFGEYDRELIRAVKSRWLLLVEQYTIPGERAGQVHLRFHLNEDGSVSELSVAENTAGDILSLYCQKAVTDSAPFGPWPEELKALVKRNYRELNFVFYY